MPDTTLANVAIKDRYPVKWTQHVWVLGIREFPSYLVAGESGCAIIEAGVSALVPIILKGFESLGLSAPLKYLIAAHAHADHVSGLIRLKRLFPELILAGSEETARILEKEKIIQNFVREDRNYAEYLVQDGFFKGLMPQLSSGAVFVDQKYKEGEEIDLGDVHIRFVNAPGHAPGNTAFWIEPDSVALISDSAGYAKSSEDILPLFFHHYQNSIISLEKIKLMAAEHVGLGHNVIISGKDASRAFLDRAIRKTKEMKAKMVRNCDTDEKTLDFAETLSEKMLDYGLFKSFSKEARMGFLQLLIRRSFESLKE